MDASKEAEGRSSLSQRERAGGGEKEGRQGVVHTYL
jgi:hypothetical protein